MAHNDTRSAKTEPRFEVPFMVIRRNNGGAYLIKGKDGREYTRSPSQLILTNLPFSENEESQFYEIQKIVGKQGPDHYIVKFKNHKDTQVIHKRDFVSNELIRKYESPSKKSKKNPLKVRFKLTSK